MDLTPGEKAVLGQIRVLYAAEARRDHQMKALMMQWPPTHHEAYKRAFAGLVEKVLVEGAGAQGFRITESGLSAIGVALPKQQPQPQPRRVDQPGSAQPASSPDTGKRKAGLVSRWLGALRPKDLKV